MVHGFHSLGSSDGHCRNCPVRFSGLCGELGQNDVSALAEESSLSKVDAGETILDQDGPCEKVGIVVSGTAKVVFSTHQGNDYLLHLLYPGQLVGDPLGVHNMVSWAAATELVLCWLPTKSLNQLIINHPSLYSGYLKAVQQQQELSQLWSAKLRGRSTLQRVAYWLLIQTRQRVKGEPEQVTITLSRRDLASYLDMSAEALCRALHQLEDHKSILRVSPELIDIRDIAKLRTLARGVEDRVMSKLSSYARSASLLASKPIIGQTSPMWPSKAS